MLAHLVLLSLVAIVFLFHVYTLSAVSDCCLLKNFMLGVFPDRACPVCFRSRSRSRSRGRGGRSRSPSANGRD